MCCMRSTLNLDDDILQELKRYADSRSVALGRAASDLIRRGLSSPVQTQTINGIQVVVLPEGSPQIDSARVQSLLEDEE